MVRRFQQLLLRSGVQSVPIAGVAAADWSPATGLILYWSESVLLLGATALLLALFARRGADPAEIRRAGIRTREVLVIHGGAFGIFGLFLAAMLFMLADKGFVGPGVIGETLAGLPWIALFIAVELAIDLVRLRSASAADLARRVDAGTNRFMLFWLVGFVGGLALVFSGRPMVLFTLFAVFKLLFEVGAVLRRVSAAPAAAGGSAGERAAT
ncbi:MAG: DUF6498-containing protein [Thermoanaerobaculia bacterium]